MPADVRHFELAWASFVNGAGVERAAGVKRATGSGTVGPRRSTEARPTPATSREAEARRMSRISIRAFVKAPRK
jgi:hypothetical protein